MAATSFVTWYFVSDHYFEKGIKSGKERLKDLLIDDCENIVSGPESDVWDNKNQRYRTPEEIKTIKEKRKPKIINSQIGAGKENHPNKNTAYGMSHLMDTLTGTGMNRPHGVILQDVINKRVRYKSGWEGIIVGSTNSDPPRLLTKWDNGDVSGFGRLEDIVEIINE